MACLGSMDPNDMIIQCRKCGGYVKLDPFSVAQEPILESYDYYAYRCRRFVNDSYLCFKCRLKGMLNDEPHEPYY